MSHKTFYSLATGHEVLGQSLRPASMYAELAIRAASSTIRYEPATSTVQVQSLHISSPLGASSPDKVCLKLRPADESDMSWGFSICSTGLSTNKNESINAYGTVALRDEANISTRRRYSFLKRLIRIERCEWVRNSADIKGIGKSLVYSIFTRVVNMLRTTKVCTEYTPNIKRQ